MQKQTKTNSNKESKPIINCAIYTRKSCEEGLEQEFNSLDAQYEAGKSYVTSQKSEGWRVYKRYDDGGYSGGNIERPGLKQLMNDVENGYINCVVVYKVDRLSRSMSDFFKLMEIFDTNDISFVSVTQSFNTTNSMGKLTLNILLSFAQFEREVTGERIRDKISLSKKKGMWMGGVMPLGYDVIEKKLIINQDESKDVEYIFRSYLEVRSIDTLKYKLISENIKTKQWIAKSGRVYGKCRWKNSMLQRLLRNTVYIGKVHHNGNVYEGEHEWIVDDTLFNQVQELLDNQNNGKNDSINNNDIAKFTVGKYLLFQKLYNENNEMFRCDACVKSGKKIKTKDNNYNTCIKNIDNKDGIRKRESGVYGGSGGNNNNASLSKEALLLDDTLDNNIPIKKVRYNYYVSISKRLKYEKIDKIVIELIRQFISSKHQELVKSDNVTQTITLSENDEIRKIDWDNLTYEQRKTLVRHLIDKIIYKDDEIRIEIDRESLANLKGYQMQYKCDIKKYGLNKHMNNVSYDSYVCNDKKYDVIHLNSNQETFNHQLYISSDNQTINIIVDTRRNRIIPTKVNKVLLKAVATGYKYKKMVEEQNHTVDTIAQQEGKSARYIARIINIGYLSPKIIESVFRAEHSESLTVIALEGISSSSMDWKVQEGEFTQYQ